MEADNKSWCSRTWPYCLQQRIQHLLKNRSWFVTRAPSNYAPGTTPYELSKDFCQTHQVVKSDRSHNSSSWNGHDTFGFEPKQEKTASKHEQVAKTPHHPWWLPQCLSTSSYPWPHGGSIQPGERGKKELKLGLQIVSSVYGCKVKMDGWLYYSHI